MAQPLSLSDIEEFRQAAHIRDDAITDQILTRVRKLDEKEEIEPFLRRILHDPNSTPHGPTEEADILTTRIRVAGKPRLAGFVLKGKSFPKVTATGIAHQVSKLRRIPGIGMMVLLAVGDIHDNAVVNFTQAAGDAKVDYLTRIIHAC